MLVKIQHDTASEFADWSTPYGVIETSFRSLGTGRLWGVAMQGGKVVIDYFPRLNHERIARAAYGVLAAREAHNHE